MTIRKIINLIESLTDSNLAHVIAEQIAGGNCEGFNPYWKLHADERILNDEDAMAHIATLVMDGFTSGAHPHWELSVIEHNNEEVEEDILFPPPAPEGPENDVIDEEVIDVVHAYMVVPVAEVNGPGNGWFEVPDEQATRFVIEDEQGNAVEYHDTREEAELNADLLNQSMSPSDMTTHSAELTEVDDDPTDNDETGFEGKENFVVIINAIHERGERQQKALRELDKRGLWLNDEQKEQAGLS